MVAGKYFQGDAAPKRLENYRLFNIFLTGKRGNTVFDIAEQHKIVRVCKVDDLHEAFKAISAPAPEMQAMSRQVRFYPEMEVCNNQQAVFSFNNESRAIPEKFHLHNSLTNPFWGW
jgi:hypothetical protein